MVPVTEVPGSVSLSTSVIGINDNDVLVGSYEGTDGHSHGFVGTNGAYTVFDANAVPDGTQPRAINNNGMITGLTNADGFDPVISGNMFEGSTSTLTFTPITRSGVQMAGIPQGINDSGVFVGGYWTGGGPSQVNGFYGFNSTYTSDLTLPFPTLQVRARGINTAGTVVGLYFTNTGVSTGFEVKNGVTYSITYPDPTQQGTNIEGINDAGVLTGSWTDASGNTHSFMLSADLTTFTLIEPAGSVDNQAWGINNDGEIAIASELGSFIYCSKNGNGHCKVNKKVKNHAVREISVRAMVKATPCVNGCHRNAFTPNVKVTGKINEKPVNLRLKPYKRVQ